MQNEVPTNKVSQTLLLLRLRLALLPFGLIKRLLRWGESYAKLLSQEKSASQAVEEKNYCSATFSGPEFCFGFAVALNFAFERCLISLFLSFSPSPLFGNLIDEDVLLVGICFSRWHSACNALNLLPDQVISEKNRYDWFARPITRC